jgi:hypothetical protein
MYRAFALLILMISGLLVGCALPQHNNTLIFSVQRDVGVGVKTPVDGTAPSLYLGYKSSEIAWVPLWANQRTETGRVTTMLCNTATVPDGRCINGPKFVGDSDTPGRNDAHDAYSTFASFGGDFGATNSSANGQVVTGKMASFFATGVAAQHLSRAPQMVGLPGSDKPKGNEDSNAPKSPASLMNDFLKSTGSSTMTVTVSSPTATATATATTTVAEFDYATQCATKLGVHAGLSAAQQTKLGTLIAKNVKWSTLVSAILDDDMLRSSRDNLGMSANLLNQQLDSALKAEDSKRAARSQVCRTAG